VAPLTFADFIDGLEALVPTDVVRRYTDGPPLSLTTADCPAQWIQPPLNYSDAPFTFGEHGGWPTLTATMVIAVGPVAQDTLSNNFANTVAMADNLTAAIRAKGLTAALASLSWSVDVAIGEVAGTAFWQVRCTVEGSSQST
jgi:hypothetical protein